jgi:hypothetical protein
MSNPIELLAKDLNAQGGVFCPSPQANMKIWNTHQIGRASCRERVCVTV